MSAAVVIDAAVRELQTRGAPPAEVDQVRKLLADLAERSRSTVRVNVGRGVVVNVPGNPAGRGFRVARPLDPP